VDGILLSKSEAKLTLIKLLDPGTASPESLVEPFKKMSGLLLNHSVRLRKSIATIGNFTSEKNFAFAL